MDESRDKLLPGTSTTHITQGEKGFAKIEVLLDATGGLSLSQVCAVTGLEGSTIQNWVKRGWVAHPKGKKYEEIQIARILIINALKECIKLEHIALLMAYLNSNTKEDSDRIIKESELYDYLCEALQSLGHADDLSRGGVESVVDRVITNYKGPSASSRHRIRKALTVMIYACVCTDVKRRTEAMMGQVLRELEDPSSIDVTKEIIKTAEPEPEPEQSAAPAPAIEEVKERIPEKSAAPEEARRTVAQALREWDLTRVEKIIQEESENDDVTFSIDEPVSKDAGGDKKTASEDKSAQKPWYFRKN